MPINDLVVTFKMNPKFMEFSEDELRNLFSYAVEEVYKSGDIIISEDDSGDKFYIIAEGEIGISKKISSDVVFFIASMQKGDIMGEMSLLSNYPRSASAVANTDVKVLSMSKDSIDKMRGEQPVIFGKFAWAMSKTLAERLYKMEERITKIMNASLGE